MSVDLDGPGLQVNKALGLLQGDVSPESPSRVQAAILDGCFAGPLGMEGALQTAELLRKRGLLVVDQASGAWQILYAIMRAVISFRGLTEAACVVAVADDVGAVLLVACKREGRMEEALSLVRSMDSPSPRHYAMAISACAPGGHRDTAEQLYKVGMCHPLLIVDRRRQSLLCCHGRAVTEPGRWLSA